MKVIIPHNIGDIVRLKDHESTLAIVRTAAQRFDSGINTLTYLYDLDSVGVKLPYNAWYTHDSLEVVDKVESLEVRLKRIEDKYN